MLAQRRIADRITPIDQSLLRCSVEPLQARRQFGKLRRAIQRTLQRIGQLVIRDVGADAPVGTLARSRHEGVDDLALAQRTHLVVDQVQNPVGMPRPVRLRRFLFLGLAAGIATRTV